MPLVSIRDARLFMEVVGTGPPLVLMHGGPGADHWTLHPFRRLADRFTLVFYDHRCNGRSEGAPVTSMTWDNFTADVEALREHLGFERWAVLGHSFGGHVALEYALRYPARVSHLVLLDTGADAVWARENAPRLALERGGPRIGRLVDGWFHGEFPANRMFPTLMRLGSLYNPHTSFLAFLRTAATEWRSKLRPEAFIHASRTLMPGWTVVDRLGEITAPTLVMAGREDFVFPPECQEQLAAGIPGARLRLVDRSGHNPHEEQTDEVMAEISSFLSTEARVLAGSAALTSPRGHLEDRACRRTSPPAS